MQELDHGIAGSEIGLGVVAGQNEMVAMRSDNKAFLSKVLCSAGGNLKIRDLIGELTLADKNQTTGERGGIIGDR